MPPTVPNRAQANLTDTCLPLRESVRTVVHAAVVRRREAPAAVRYWHLLSLDAPTVAVVWSLAFAWLAHVRLPLWLLLLQALVVWAVYVGDRLLDARTGLRQRDGEELRERHFFHWRHRAVLTPLAVLASGAAACLILRWMPVMAKERSSMLGAASLAYFARVHTGGAASRLRRFATKELLVGVLFTTGCALPAWSRGGSSWALLAAALYFAALAWLNCRAIEEWESGALRSGIWRKAQWIAAVGFTAAGLVVCLDARTAVLLAAGAASAFLLGALDRMRPRMSAVLLRAAADLVLLTPALVLAAQWGRR
ncbi:MAG: hypothetical protein ACLGSH_09670 [Acidobacteriota bacterium]